MTSSNQDNAYRRGAPSRDLNERRSDNTSYTEKRGDREYSDSRSSRSNPNYRQDRGPSLPRRKEVTPREMVDRLITASKDNEFTPKMFDLTIQALIIPKKQFIDKIKNDCMTTAMFIKHFYGADGFINYSDLTFLGHILLYSLDLKENQSAVSVRNKIGGNDIWRLEHYDKEGVSFEIIRKTVNKIPKESIQEVSGDVVKWYDEFKNILDTN